ncbi:histidine N-acetyltransferase-like [Haliotis asinina]|uniref:histidine N-acetyltransferase-like n=1 Tax=Haliotis asinina TaxID=109174 RepID=UPI003531EA59
MLTRKVLKLISSRRGCQRLFFIKTASVNCRRAILEDFAGVVNINPNVLRGRDYVPARYDRIITDPNMSAYVAEVDNKIVAFACARLLDGGRTFLLLSGRVHVSYQGQGIMGKLVRHIKGRHSNNSNILYESFVTDGGNPLLSQVSQNSSEVLTRRVHCFAFPLHDIPLDALKLHGTQISTPTQEHLEKLMSENNCRLFPGGRLIVDWIPLRTDPQNVPLMIKTTHFHTDKSPEQDCLSFGSSYPCNIGLAYNLDIYGNHPESLRAHLHAHLLKIAHNVQRSREYCCDVVDKAHGGNPVNVHLLVYTCMTVDTAILQTLHKLGFPQMEYPVKTQIVMEKSFEKE